ncbi:MAG: DUF6702 family protein [Aureispira sp.]
MIKYLVWVAFFVQTTAIWAHQPDLSSTVLMEQKDGSWLLQVKAALTAFEYEVETTYGAESYKTPEEFRALVLQHLQNRIILEGNGDIRLLLKDGYVQLGHETNVLFKIEGMPDSLHRIDVRNTSFEDIHHNQSALMILKESFQQQQFVLNNKNQHQAYLQVRNNRFECLEPAIQTTEMAPLGIIGFCLLVGLSMLLFYRQKVLLA